ncbi:MAG: hypothetical protein EBZ49_01270 [Proteobacteria bacterium]|nr:hypothetical protein [Pseudomonadota bacterium]
MKNNLIEGLHYYFDQSIGLKGAIVFTEAYHLQRGKCCGNKCRHCPYFPKYEKGTSNTTVDKKFPNNLE